jgi:membrane fusion protein (multidrug efflux system)
MVVRRVLISVVGIFMFCAVAVAQGPPPAKVVLGQVTKENVSKNQSVTGVIYYERVSEISTEVAGLVEVVEVNQGDHVTKGDPLVRLNTEILESEMNLTKTRIEQIELRIHNKKKNFKRLERLYKSSGVSEKDYDDALYTFQDALKEKQIAQRNLEKLLIQKRRSIISAPFDGIVLSKDVDSGGWVQQGKQLVSIGSSNDLFVRAPIAEKLLQYIEFGEKVEVTINAFSKQIEGVVSGIDPVADLKTKNIFLKIKIPPMSFVAQNMSANVLVPSSGKRELSVFSRAALIKFKGKDFVYSVKEGKAAILPVHIVAFLGDRVAVDTEYIVPGLPIVVEGNERLRPDQAVVVAGDGN